MRRVSKRPAFGIVGAPVETAVLPGSGPQTVDVATYGFVPRERVRADRAGRDPLLEPAVEAATRGDWYGAATNLRAVGDNPDRHLRAIADIAEPAVHDDGWLIAWLDAAPADANVWSVHAQAMVRLAWRLRTSAAAREVLPEQWVGFHRVLGQAPAACERATSLAPGLATPWIVLMSCAQGLGWDHDRFREIWARVIERAPHSVGAHQRALHYWLPRWQGSEELAGAFVAETRQRAQLGSLLTGIQLEYLFLERGPGVSAELNAALDAAVADRAAAAPDHPYLIHHRHWLAYFLTKAGRYAEAIEEFRAIDGYAGARPWELYADPVGSFCATRAEAILGWRAAAQGA